MSEHKVSLDLLRERQAWPLEKKIEHTLHQIQQYDGWARTNGYNGAYLAISGGKDSTVLHHIAKSDPFTQHIPSVFSDTGLEYPEVREMALRLADTVVRPAKSFKEVVEKYGYPAISKQVATKLHKLRTAKPGSAGYRLIMEGITSAGRVFPQGKLAEKWKYLINGEVRISGQCCDELKKKPMLKYAKKARRVPIVGVMAGESNGRERDYLRYGCNAIEGNKPMSRPMAFWTEQDILSYIHTNEIPLASVYGEIVVCSGQYELTGVQRTGCIFCAFGCHLEKKSRFKQLKETHPKLWDYCKRVLGTDKILKVMGVDISWDAEGYEEPAEQINLFEKCSCKS